MEKETEPQPPESGEGRDSQIDTRYASVDASWLVSRCQDALREAGQTGAVRRAQYLRDCLEIILSQSQACIASFRPPAVEEGGSK